MEIFDVVILAFTTLVLTSILIGSIAICVRCIQGRQHRRLSPIIENVDGENQQRVNNNLPMGKWPGTEAQRRQQNQVNGIINSNTEQAQVRASEEIEGWEMAKTRQIILGRRKSNNSGIKWSGAATATSGTNCGHHCHPTVDAAPK